MQRGQRVVISVLVGVALAALIAFAQTATTQQSPAAGIAGTPIGNNFEGLIDQDSKPVDTNALAGKYQLVFFGFTRCPSICPTELLRVKTILAGLTPGERAKLAPIFVTLDPARDSPKLMKDYVAMFDPSILALSGPEETTQTTIKAWKVYAAKVDTEDGDYTVDHSAFLYFRGPDGVLLDLFDHAEPTPDVMAAVKAQIPD